MNIMQKKYIIALIIIAIVVYVGFWANREPVVAPAGEKAPVVATIATTTAQSSPAAVTKKTGAKSSSVSGGKVTTVSVPVTPAMTAEGAYIISYTASGFVPPVVEIRQGKSVHFVNDSNKAMSIASQEPNDQVYGELNQGKTVGRGGTYDFTFLKTGTWKYLNRNNSLDTGVIIVK